MSDATLFVPVVEGATIGNGDLTGSTERGLSLKIDLVLGSTSALYGPVAFRIPSPFIPDTLIVGVAHDISTGVSYALDVQRRAGGRLLVQVWEAAGVCRHPVDISGTVPFTWATGDRILLRTPETFAP